VRCIAILSVAATVVNIGNPTGQRCLQVVLRKLHDGRPRNLIASRQVCRRLRDYCDAQITCITVQLHVRDVKWQLPILARFRNLSELHMDLRHGCTKAHDLYALLADVLRAAPGLQYLHVLCGLSGGATQLAMPFTGVVAMPWPS
jgi:hypothetical protein